MDNLNLLNLLLPQDGLRVLAYRPRGWTNGFKHEFYNTNADLCTRTTQLDAAKLTTYYGLASFQTPESRSAANALALQCFWADLDFKHYADEDEAWADVDTLEDNFGEPSAIILSGGGIHVYWALTEPLAVAQWTVIARQFQKRWQALGVRADSISADAARVLRLPGTHNYKYSPAPEVTWQYGDGIRYPASNFADNSLPLPQSNQSLNGDLGGGVEHRPSNVKNIILQCKQMQEQFNKRDKASEPEWYSVIQLTRHVEDGRKISHFFSHQHPGYSLEGTDNKLQQLANKNVGPTTCDKFRDVNPSGCAGCTLNVKSPIVLGYSELVEDKPMTVENPEATGEQLAVVLPQGYSFDGSRTFRRVVNPDTKIPEDVQILDSSFAITRVTQAAGAFSVEFQAQPVGQEAIKGSIPSEYLSSAKDLSKALNSQGVFVVPKNANHVLDLTHKMLAMVREQQKDTELPSQFGWQSDGKTFITGDTAYVDGVKASKRIVPQGALASMAHWFKPTGELANWKAGAEVYNKPGGEAYQFALCYGAAGLLLPSLGVTGSMLSLYSRGSGRGKSTVGFAALSIWGNPAGLKSQSNDTTNALFRKAGLFNNIPMMFDELTDRSASDVYSLVYSITQGRDKASLTQNRSFQQSDISWSLPSIATSNISLANKLTSHVQENQGTLYRVLDVNIDTPFADSVSYEESMILRGAFTENYGIVGPMLTQAYMTNKEKIDTLVKQIMAGLDAELAAGSAARYWIASASAALAIMVVGRELGLWAYNILAAKRWIIDMLKSQTVNAQQAVVTGESILTDFVRNNGASIIHTKMTQSGNLVMTPDDGDTRSGKLLARIDEAVGQLWVSATDLRQFCLERGTSISAFLLDMKSIKGLMVEPTAKSRMLGMGTKKFPGYTSVYIFNLNHPALANSQQGSHLKVV